MTRWSKYQVKPKPAWAPQCPLEASSLEISGGGLNIANETF